MRIAWFGSVLTPYLCGVIRALVARGHRISFFEAEGLPHARGYDVVINTGHEVSDEAVLDLQTPTTTVVFWDLDAPTTLERIQSDVADPFRAALPRYDLVLTHGGSRLVTASYVALGARSCVPIHCALDPAQHHRVDPDPRFVAALGFLGNRLPDREARIEGFLLDVAARLPDQPFLLGGTGWADKPLPPNVHYVGYVPDSDHNAFNSTPLALLDVHRQIAGYGYSPASRVFDAAGAGACVISDPWQGLHEFFEPDQEVLLAESGDHVAQLLRDLTPGRARKLGGRAMRRVLAEHTYAHRAVDIETALGATRSVGWRGRRASAELG